MAAHEIRGIPPQCQILHVEQEVAGEECTVMEVGTCGGYVCVWVLLYEHVRVLCACVGV